MNYATVLVSLRFPSLHVTAAYVAANSEDISYFINHLCVRTRTFWIISAAISFAMALIKADCSFY